MRKKYPIAGVLVLCISPAAFAGIGNAPASADWPNAGNDKGGMRYSPLDQVNRENVARLRVAWTYQTGDSTPGRTIECTPLVVGGVMYVTTVDTKAVALDAATGKEIWKFDPYGPPYKPAGSRWVKASGGVNRGVAYWSDAKPVADGGKRRVLLGTSDGRVFSLDAKSGSTDPAFGKDGVLDLRAGIERDVSKMFYGPTSPPMVFEDLVIVGCSNDESHPAAPGDPRAFDVRTGKEVWRFHTLPRPGEFAAETWEPTARSRTAAGPTRGAGSRSTRRPASCSAAPGRPRPTTTAAAERATTSSPTAPSPSTPAPASGCGISRTSATTCGTTTTPARRSSCG